LRPSHCFSVLANPENPPKIDWAAYKKTVPVAGMVDAFQKQYEALKVPFPADTVSSQIESQKSATQKEIEKFVAESKTRIAKHESELAHLKSLLPFNQMTMEDYRDAYPEQALDPINRPTLWPHTPEEQPENQAAPEEHH
jgi:F-type H+-transporting ATPase subunit d